MADTGVCVHPEDERYAGLVGKKIVVPVIGRVVPLFADRYVDKEFGTGALKVTPATTPTTGRSANATASNSSSASTRTAT